jgi:hypothetical protein
VTQQPIPRQLTDGDLYVSARTADWAYIENTATDQQELYHRGRDPDQQDNLIESEDVPKELFEQLVAVVSDHVSDLGGTENGSDQLDDDISTRLEALGYK